MTDFVISCDTFARLASLTTDAPDDFKTVRLENGIAVASNRRLLAAEKMVNSTPGILHIVTDEALVKQCEEERAFGSNLTITYTEMLNHACAKTTFGYVHSSCLASIDPAGLNRWWSLVDQCRTPAPKSRGGMFWDADTISRLAAASPSGRVIFEENIDATGRPTIIRDVTTYEWFGMFQAYVGDKNYQAATLPTWAVQQ